ncbi:receptor-type tyrosine-protein phosphatase epsilon-like [Amblyomma americanum]
MISEAEADGEVDFVKQLHTMRHSRMNMVETAEQYIFSHKMLVVMICTRGRKLTVEEFLAQYQHLKAKHPVTGKTPISKEFEELGRKRPHPGAADYKGARDERNVCKNRTLKILAADIKRPLLSVKNDVKKTDYINAVFVDGYKKENAYLVTQMPLPETVDDFWEMVAGSGSITLVTLGPLVDERTPQFWPELSRSLQLGAVEVSHTESTESPALAVRSFIVSQQTKPPRIVKQFHCSAWQSLERTSWSCCIALDTLRHVEQWQMRAEGAPIVVLCLDGCKESGLFCVLASICDQLKNEHELDVFRCVQRVRASRPEFITNAGQYAFCYEVAHAFVESFGAYSNFT